MKLTRVSRFAFCCISAGYLFSATGLGAVAQDKSADAVRSYSEGLQSRVTKVSDSVTSVGYLDPDAILVFANNPTLAVFARQGDTVNGITLVTVNDKAVRARGDGQDFSMEMSDKPFAVPEYQLQNYLVNICHRIDLLEPGVTEKRRVTIGPTGMPVSDNTTVGYFVRSQPYGPLPAGAKALTFDVWYGPGKNTDARIVSVQLDKPFVREAAKPPAQ